MEVNVEDLMALENQTVIKFKAEEDAKIKLEEELNKLKQGKQPDQNIEDEGN